MVAKFWPVVAEWKKSVPNVLADAWDAFFSLRKIERTLVKAFTKVFPHLRQVTGNLSSHVGFCRLRR